MAESKKFAIYQGQRFLVVEKPYHFGLEISSKRTRWLAKTDFIQVKGIFYYTGEGRKTALLAVISPTFNSQKISFK